MEEKILASWIGIALYTVLVTYVGVKYYAKIKSISDFVVAGRSLGFWVTWGTILATWFCSGTSLGGAQMTYLYGMRGVVMDPIASALAVILFGLFFAAKLRRLKYITVADFFRYRYGPEMEIASALVQILGYIGWLGGLLLAYSVVFQILLGWEREPGLYLATLITIFYTTLGGMFAVALLDFIRVFIFWVAMWIGLYFAFAYLGGVDVLVSKLSPDDFSILPGRGYEYLGYVGLFGLLYYIASWINQPLGSISCQDLVQRGLSAKDEKTSSRAAIAAGVSYWIIGLTGGALYGLIAKVLFPALDQPEMAMPMVVMYTAPTWAFALFVVGLLATIMSSADSAALIPPSMFARNILPYIKSVSEEKAVQIMRIIVVVGTLGALWIALYLPHIYFLTQMAWYMMMFVQTIPFIMGIYWKKANRIGAITQAVFNVAMWIVLGSYFYGQTGDVWAAFYMPGPIIMPLGLVVFVVTSLLTQHISPPKELVELPA
ncbi:Na+/solute symporter [Thermogladius calderae 1633]|uniref:Na+/solute symporter n=1 Tax=Thermogladius calderae (strain DSM 22663 / VKM B-2946 / 1633) TaxID=1184251 RepID=I3TFF2_THEC1|nr:Na+/solute symporter [Thermogladius calderae]AFK51490.1 Na+/solute symporter [Thermogladius calderae 1633]